MSAHNTQRHLASLIQIHANPELMWDHAKHGLLDNSFDQRVTWPPFGCKGRFRLLFTHPLQP